MSQKEKSYVRYYFNRFWGDYKRGIYDVGHLHYYLPSFYILPKNEHKRLHGLYYVDYHKELRELDFYLDRDTTAFSGGWPSLYYYEPGLSAIAIKSNGRTDHVSFSIDSSYSLAFLLNKPYILLNFYFETYISIYSNSVFRRGAFVDEQYMCYSGVVTAFRWEPTSSISRPELLGSFYFIDRQVFGESDFCDIYKVAYVQPRCSYNFSRAFEEGFLLDWLYFNASRFFYPDVPFTLMEMPNPREVFLRAAFFAFSGFLDKSFSTDLKRVHDKCINDSTFRAFDSLVLRSPGRHV